jgi:phytoene synthase
MMMDDLWLWLRRDRSSSNRHAKHRFDLHQPGSAGRGVTHPLAPRTRYSLEAPHLSPTWREKFRAGARLLTLSAQARSNASSLGASLVRDAQLESSFTRCAQITRHASTNFYYAFMLLPVERRRALYAVYAFCRFVDDIADEAGGRDPAQMLERWRDELDRVYRAQPTRPVSRALAASVQRFGLPREPFEQIIAGVEMDLSRSRYETFEDLKLYCQRVASAVGLICIEIFGYRNPLTKVYADKLGIALQLTNILRDVGEDAARARIYLPLEDLRRFHVEPEEILSATYSERFRALMHFQAMRARSYYDAAEAALTAQDRPCLLAAEGMRAIYRAILERIISADYRVFGRRQNISSPHKLYLVGRLWINERLWHVTERDTR